MSEIFFRPERGWVGDVIPYVDGTSFQLFFLHDMRDEAAPGTSWTRVSTDDFLTYTDHGVAIAHGGPEDLDLHAYTGSVVEDEGVHHCFYTGYNPAVVDEAGIPLQWVMHAVSTDGMASWTKIESDTFRAPATGYEAGDWRDPFVYRAAPDGPWSMLLAARTLTGPERRRGVVARLVSDDLTTWTPVEPLWAPARYITHECPDLFRIGDWWYLVYSEFSEAYTTRYVISRSPEGPWYAPAHDTVDGRGFYAAKTAARGEERYAFGWIPSREGGADDGAYQWAGTLAVHQVHQLEDGQLAFALPGPVAAAHTDTRRAELDPVVGPWEVGTDGMRVDVRHGAGFASAVTGELPSSFLCRLTLQIEEGTHEVGLMLRTSADADHGYQIRLEPHRGRMVFDRWPRRTTGPLQWQISGDVPHYVELERPVTLDPGTHQLEVLVDGDAFTAYLDATVAMSGRIYDRPTGGLAVFVAAGAATFDHPVIATLPSAPHPR